MKNILICREVSPRVTIVALLLLTCGFYKSNAQYYGTRTMSILPDIDVEANRTNVVNDSELCLYGSQAGDKVKRDRVAYLRFNLGTVPLNARIDAIELRLYLRRQVNSSGEQFVRVYELRGQGDWSAINWQRQPVADANVDDLEAIARAKVSTKHLNKAVDFSMQVGDGDTWLATKGSNLWFIIAANSQQYAYYSSRSGDRSRQPKLIITYHMPQQFQASSWPQYKYNAQHTGQLEWKSNATATGYNIRTVFTPTGSNAIKSDPVLCNGRLIFYHQSKDVPRNSMRSYSGSGSLVAENVDINGIVRFTPVADRNNNIYCITGFSADTIQMLNGNTLEKMYSRKIPEGAQVSQVPVVGFDGSLYLSTDKGLYAFSPMSEFKIKWKYGSADNSFGTVALSDDEKKVYVFDGNKGKQNANGSLLEIDNQQGTFMWGKTGFLTYATDIPVPVVRGDKVCLTDGFRIGRSFSIVDRSKDTIITIVGSGTVISEPVTTRDEAYIINGTKLQSYKLADGTRREYDLPDALNFASTMALDGDGNLYILNTKLNDQSVTLIPVGGKPVTFRDTKPSTWKNLTGNAFLLSPDGCMIARSDNFLYSFYPTGFTEKKTKKIPESGDVFASQFLYRVEDTIRVLGKTVTKNQNVIIQAGKGVGFQNEFKVQNGAQLTVKTGY